MYSHPSPEEETFLRGGRGEQNLITMHAGKVLYSSCVGKHRAGYKKTFIRLKAVLTFQTLMLAMLGKWVITHDRVLFRGKEVLL